MSESYPLNVGDEALTALATLRNEVKFSDLPGCNTGEEQARCSSHVNELLDRLIAGVVANPRKSWVLEQWVSTLEAACDEDTEARERFGPYFEQIMDILCIESSDEMLNFYLGFGGANAA